MDPEWLPKNAVVCPGHISFSFIEEGRKKMHEHPRSLFIFYIRNLFKNLCKNKARIDGFKLLLISIGFKN